MRMKGLEEGSRRQVGDPNFEVWRTASTQNPTTGIADEQLGPGSPQTGDEQRLSLSGLSPTSSRAIRLASGLCLVPPRYDPRLQGYTTFLKIHDD